MAAALFQGASIGPLIDLAIQIDPSQGKLSLHLWLPEELFLSSSPYLSIFQIQNPIIGTIPYQMLNDNSSHTFSSSSSPRPTEYS
jgi:hypothetical protein